MDAKLTLKLDAEVIALAKEYAKEQNRSLSRIVENYLKLLASREVDSNKEIEITPFVKNLTQGDGSLIPPDYDYKKGYGDYLDEKHK